MMSQRVLGSLWELWERVYLLTRARATVSCHVLLYSMNQFQAIKSTFDVPICCLL